MHIETERLILRDFRESDLDDLQATKDLLSAFILDMRTREEFSFLAPM